MLATFAANECWSSGLHKLYEDRRLAQTALVVALKARRVGNIEQGSAAAKWNRAL